MKIIGKLSAAAVASLALVSLAHAAAIGPYAGIGLGYSKLETPSITQTNIPGVISTSEDKGGLGGRLFAGYNFNEYLGLEASVNDFANSTYKANSSLLGMNQKLQYSLLSENLVAKAYLPIQNSGVNVYALGGAAYVQSQAKLTSNVPGMSATYKTNAIRPVAGIGVSYDASRNITAGVEASRIFGRGNLKTSNSAIPNADMVSFNISYNFN